MNNIVFLKKKLQNMLIQHFSSCLSFSDIDLISHYVFGIEEHFIFLVAESVFKIIVCPSSVCFYLCSDVFDRGCVRLAVRRFDS